MRGLDVPVDAVVVDSDGTLWMFDAAVDQWRYVAGAAMFWDGFDVPPERYEPYTELDTAVTALLRRAIARCA